MVTPLWLAVIAAFMWTGAGQAIKATRFRERLPALQARRLARKAISVAASTPLAEAIRRADEARPGRVVVVDHEDKPIAIVNETAVMATPPQRQPVDRGRLAGQDPRPEPGAARRPVRAWPCWTPCAAPRPPSTCSSSRPARSTACWPTRDLDQRLRRAY